MLLIINEKGEIVIITKQNPRGGPEIKSYRLSEDPNTGVLGYKIGYCPCGCGEPLLIRTLDLREIIAHFGFSMEDYDKMMKKYRPKVRITERLIKALQAFGRGD